MFGSSFHHTASDDESDRNSSSIPTTEFDWRHRFLAPTSRFHPAHPASHSVSSASDPSYAFLNDILPSNNFTPSTPTQSSLITGYFNPSPPLPPPTFCGILITSDADDSHSSHSVHPESFGVDSLFSQHDLPAVAIPTMIGHFKYDGELTSTHDASCSFNDNRMTNYPLDIPPASIAKSMAMGPTFGVEMSKCTDPIFQFCSDSPLLSSGHSISTFQNPPPFNPEHNVIVTPCKNFNTESDVCLSPPLSSPTSPCPETPLNLVSPQPNVAASPNQLGPITVPSEAVEFPPPPFTEKISFFRCQCKNNCGTWITSEDRVIKDHMTRVHNVLKEKDGSFHCPWVGCSSTRGWSGMVRHVQTHLDLKWQCSVCKKRYTRPDCVRGHANKVSGCKAGHPNSYPSELAYTAWNNGDGTITLTKML